MRLGQDIFNIKTYFVDTVKKFVADYQAKLGNFLVLKQKLYVLQERISKLPQSLDTTSVLADINSALASQETLEISGFAVIDVLNKIKSDPVIQDALKGKYPQWLELEKWTLLQNTLNNVNRVAGTAQVFFGSVFAQQKFVEDIERRVALIEGGKPSAGAGFQFSLAGIPTAVWTIGLSLLFFGYRIFRTERSVRRGLR